MTNHRIHEIGREAQEAQERDRRLQLRQQIKNAEANIVTQQTSIKYWKSELERLDAKAQVLLFP